MAEHLRTEKRDRVNLDGFIGRSLVFYAQYHQHPVNITIHIIFVPTIMFASLILLAYAPSLRDFQVELAPAGLPAWLQRCDMCGQSSVKRIHFSTASVRCTALANIQRVLAELSSVILHSMQEL